MKSREAWAWEKSEALAKDPPLNAKQALASLLQPLDQEWQHAPTILVWRMGFEIDMAGAFDSPEQLRLWGPVEERGRLSDRGAIVVRAGRQQHRRSRLRDMVDGAKIGRAQVEHRR